MWQWLGEPYISWLSASGLSITALLSSSESDSVCMAGSGFHSVI